MNLVYKARNFNGMIYNPFEVDNDEFESELEVGRLGNLFVGLSDVGHPDMKKEVAKYVLYLYDKGSPLRSFQPDIMKRKVEAATLAGFNMEDEETLQEMYKLKDVGAMKCMLALTRFINSKEWMSLVTNEDYWWTLQELIAFNSEDYKDFAQKVATAKNKAALLKESNELLDTIRGLEMIIFGGDEDAKEVDVMERAGITPEEIARKEVKFPDGYPYE